MDELHRVRTIIPFLPGLTVLKKEKIIPNKPIFPTYKKGGKTYAAAKKMGYSEHGLFMEEVIEKALTPNLDIEKYLEYLKRYSPIHGETTGQSLAHDQSRGRSPGHRWTFARYWFGCRDSGTRLGRKAWQQDTDP